MLEDPHDLQRFVDAQNAVYTQVCAELRQGRKTSHWIWYIFPQIEGLGSSSTARHYAIGSLAEAKAYVEHPLLGARLRECTGLVNALEGKSIREIFGSPDDLKFRSCMTLFSRATSNNQIFQDALQKYFGGKPDPLTLDRL